MMPHDELLAQAFHYQTLSVEYVPELRGAFEPVPAHFALYAYFHGTKMRLGTVDAKKYIEAMKAKVPKLKA